MDEKTQEIPELPELPEDKQSFHRRIKQAGLTGEVYKFKDNLIAKYRQEGMKRPEAQHRAWCDMMAKYPPPPEDESPPAQPLPAPSDDTFVSDAMWVYANITRNVALEDAPSPGAYGLLQWAKDCPNDFYKTTMPKVLDIKAKQAGTANQTDQEDEELGELEELLG